MKNKLSIIILFAFSIVLLMLSQCNEKKPDSSQMNSKASSPEKPNYHGFENQLEWGEHLVIIGGCHDCHTPKKMTVRGPVLDSALWLSGHPSDMPLIDINRKEIEEKGLAVTSDLTEWVGPWGISFSANLTPDPTGIGNLDVEQFIYALREGKAKGIPGSRSLLPPMPWEMIGHMTDDELKAVFAYLKSLKPINNLVPMPIPPTGMNN
jgi:mono/diheme cytochrome c family protein